MNKIPVIILNYNSSADCRKCVSFLKRQERVELELVLVDNCSRPDDLEQLRALAREEGCTLLESKENRGYNAGNNIGLRYAAAKGYEYAMIANPDMEFPQRDYVFILSAQLLAEPMVAAIGSRIVDAAGVDQNPLNFVSFWGEFLWPFTSLCYHFAPQKSLGTVIKEATKGYCPVLSGCCFLIRVNFLSMVGFFDENVFLYCEEAIFAKQVQRAGMKLYYTNETCAVHRHIKSEKGNPYKRLRIMCDSRDYKNKYYSDYNTLQVGLLRKSNALRKMTLILMEKNG